MRRGDHTGRTEAALKRVVAAEGGLQGAQCVFVAEPFHGNDTVAIDLHGQHQASSYRFAIDNHRAGPAHPVLAPQMGSRKL